MDEQGTHWENSEDGFIKVFTNDLFAGIFKKNFNRPENECEEVNVDAAILRARLPLVEKALLALATKCVDAKFQEIATFVKACEEQQLQTNQEVIIVAETGTEYRTVAEMEAQGRLLY